MPDAPVLLVQVDGKRIAAAVRDLDHGHRAGDAHIDSAVVDLPPGHARSDTRDPVARGNQLAGGHVDPDAQMTCASGITLPPTSGTSQPNGAASAATISDPGQCLRDTHTWTAGADLHDALLAVLADALDDLEGVRIATDNRARSLRQVKGLEGTKFEANLNELQEALAALEHKATLDLQRAMRMHPLAGFVKAMRGLGEKQAARLLAAIGNPADRANPAKLWQYAGHGDPARSRKRRGQVVEFNPTAKMRVHLCAESAVQAGVRKREGCDDSNGYDLAHRDGISRLGEIYLRERAKWADRDTTDGHKHNHALRVVGKTILLDLWKAAREVQA